jgi:DNA helicase-2/ATP-dependent DNA helicase PcrA
MTPSKYQTSIYDAVSETTDSLQIDAVAGSGKTTTLVEASSLIKGNGRFMAFNRDIANSLKEKAPNLKASTLNGFGWGICLNNVQGVELDAQKTQKIFSGGLDFSNSDDKKFYRKYRGTVNRLVSLCKNLFIVEPNIQDFNELLKKYDLLMDDPGPELERLLSAAQAIHTRSVDMVAVMDYDDQIFMPLYREFRIPKHDWIMVDESQDLNRSNILLVTQAARRLMSVGDPNQGIYRFRGADPEAMNLLKEMSNARTLPLSVCYRCAKTIVRAAAAIVPHIEAFDASPEGIVDSLKKEQLFKDAQDGDYILCRTNAPLVTCCLRFIREGRKATVKGRDVAEQLINLINDLSKEQADMTSEYFWEVLKAYQVARISQLEAVEAEDAIEALNDRVATILAVLEQVNTVGELITKLNSIFMERPTTGIILSSVHKAKGLESKRVFIIEPKLLGKPHKDPEIAKQEKNLSYVAITRAKEHLTYVE